MDMGPTTHFLAYFRLVLGATNTPPAPRFRPVLGLAAPAAPFGSFGTFRDLGSPEPQNMHMHVLGLLADRLPRRPTFRPRGTVGPRAPLALVAHDPQHWCTAIYDMLDSSYLNTQTHKIGCTGRSTGHAYTQTSRPEAYVMYAMAEAKRTAATSSQAGGGGLNPTTDRARVRLSGSVLLSASCPAARAPRPAPAVGAPFRGAVCYERKVGWFDPSLGRP